MHDLYYNLKHSQLANLIVERLKMMSLEGDVRVGLPSATCGEGTIEVSSGFASQSKCGVTGWYLLLRGKRTDRDRVTIGVQIEGNAFRFFVETAVKYAEAVAVELERRGLRFDFGMVSGWGTPKKGRVHFKKLDGDNNSRQFRYREVMVASALPPTVEEVVERACGYAHVAIRSREIIIHAVDAVKQRGTLPEEIGEVSWN